VVDRKPPIVPYIYAAVFAAYGRDSLIAVHVVAIAWLFATALVIFFDARRRFGEPGARWATGLFVAATAAYLPADTLAANFEIFMLLPASLAVALAHAAGVRFSARRAGSALASGALVAVAALCKQTGAVALIPVLVSLRDGARRLTTLLLALVGCAAVLAIAGHLFGAHELYFWMVRANRS